jgi:hypothetical protein
MLFGVALVVVMCILSLGGAIALIVGATHAWPVAGMGAGLASVLAAVGIRLQRKRSRH